jgi:hypothetical protein
LSSDPLIGVARGLIDRQPLMKQGALTKANTGLTAPDPLAYIRQFADQRIC